LLLALHQKYLFSSSNCGHKFQADVMPVSFAQDTCAADETFQRNFPLKTLLTGVWLNFLSPKLEDLEKR